MRYLQRTLLSPRRIAGRIIGWALPSSSRWSVSCGRPLRPGEVPPQAIISVVADQLGIDPAVFGLYAQREETRREHAREIVAALDLQPVRTSDYRTLITVAAREAAATEQGAPITKAVIEALKDRTLLVPVPELLIRQNWPAERRHADRLIAN